MLPSEKQHERSEPPACPADYVYVTSITRNYAYYGYVTSLGLPFIQPEGDDEWMDNVPWEEVPEEAAL